MNVYNLLEGYSYFVIHSLHLYCLYLTAKATLTRILFSVLRNRQCLFRQQGKHERKKKVTLLVSNKTHYCFFLLILISSRVLNNSDFYLITQYFLAMAGEAERFDETGGYSHYLLDNNQVFEKTMETYGGEYARGQKEYSTGQHCIRFQLEPVDSGREANQIIVGIISSGVAAKDQYFNRTPSTYGWQTLSNEWENETTIIQNGKHHRVSKDKWPGAKTGDILELTIDCDQRTISIENQTKQEHDSINVDLEKCPLPWKFIVIFFTRPDRVRLL